MKNAIKIWPLKPWINLPHPKWYSQIYEFVHSISDACLSDFVTIADNIHKELSNQTKERIMEAGLFFR